LSADAVASGSALVVGLEADGELVGQVFQRILDLAELGDGGFGEASQDALIGRIARGSCELGQGGELLLSRGVCREWRAGHCDVSFFVGVVLFEVGKLPVGDAEPSDLLGGQTGATAHGCFRPVDGVAAVSVQAFV
jgi:hypothetical protein